MQTYLEQAFGKSDRSSVKMRVAVREWMDLYYGASRSGEDGSARLAVLIVSKLCRTVFAEYERASCSTKHHDWAQQVVGRPEQGGKNSDAVCFESAASAC